MKTCYLALCALILPAFFALVAAHAAAAPILNSSFDKPVAGEGGGSKGPYYSIVDGKGRNGGKCLMYRKETEKPSPQGTKENFHYDFVVPVQPGTAYVASAWFKAEGDLRPSVRIATMDWQTLTSGLCADSKDWQEVRVVFQSGANKEIRFQIFGGGKTEARETEVGISYADDVMVRQATEDDARAMRQCRVTVDANSVLREINPLFFGVNTLFWIEDDASLKDGKLARQLREMPCRLMRFPGGEVGDNYHWKTKKLDNVKQFPFSEGPDKLDCDKFMILCRQVGAEPIFMVNLESGFVHNDIDAAVREAVEWVQYANKEKGYNVRYWEIGNETYLPGTYYPTTAREYAEAVVKFSRAMKAVDPAIKIGVNGPMEVNTVVQLDRLSKEELARHRTLARGARKDEVKKTAAKKTDGKGDPWWPTVVKIAGADMNFAIVHRYYPNVFGPDANAGKPIVALRQYLAKQLPGREIPIALTEWNANKNTQAGLAPALLVAEVIGDYVTAGVDMANLWPMRYTGAFNARVLFDVKTNEPRPSYTVMKLYSSNMGPGSKVVKTSASNKTVYTCASLSGAGVPPANVQTPSTGVPPVETGDTQRLAIFLINKSPTKEGTDVTIAFVGFAGKAARAQSLTAPDLKSDKAVLSDTPVTMKGGALGLALPPDSLTVVTVE